MDNERRDKRAKSIAAMGLVKRVGDRFQVSTPSLRGHQSFNEVWRDDKGAICCNCLEFQEEKPKDVTFRCEHIIAVKYSLLAKNTEAAATHAAPTVEPEKNPEGRHGYFVNEFDVENSKDIRIEFWARGGYAQGAIIINSHLLSPNDGNINEVNLARKICNFLNEEQTYKYPEVNKDHIKDPTAKSVGDLITAKQLGMIRYLCREKGVDAESECALVYAGCSVDGLSKKAASGFIQHLQNLGNEDLELERPEHHS